MSKEALKGYFTEHFSKMQKDCTEEQTQKRRNWRKDTRAEWDAEVKGLWDGSDADKDGALNKAEYIDFTHKFYKAETTNFGGSRSFPEDSISAFHDLLCAHFTGG